MSSGSEAQPPQRVVPPSRRRDKPILSCTLCRRRKLKCDRQHPCKTCVDRGLSLSCEYARHAHPGHEPKPSYNVHDRIDQLEKLVTTLMDEKKRNGASNSPETPLSSSIDNGEAPSAPGRVKLDDDATSYSNSEHWSTILDGITELRDQLDQIPTTAQPRDPNLSELSGPDLLFGGYPHLSKPEVLAGVPPKAEADTLFDIYFSSMDMAPAILHKPTFIREYDRFWENPFEAPVMWLSMLFSIFAMAIRFQSVLDDPTGDCEQATSSLYSARIDAYREKAVQCLILANYAKCPPYTIEALLHYFVNEYFRSQDSQFGIWLLNGLVVRIAFRMGYHREPSKFPNITPFKAEMRRRLWLMVARTDLMLSSQLGLPTLIQQSVCDVTEPRNLNDDEIHENMTELPPSRPETEHTSMLYTLVRSRILHTFSLVADLANSTTQPLYRDVMELDATLRDVYEKLPPVYKAIRAKDFEYTDSSLAMRRLYLRLTFLKAELMLHRPFVLMGRTDTRYERSRLVCLNAALEILEFQQKLCTATRPGGRLWSSKWRIWSASWRLSSLVTHDFLLATTVLSLDLDRDIAAPLTTSEESTADPVQSKSAQPSRAEIVKALTGAYDIWMTQSQWSREAKKVAAAVRMVLGKAKADVENDTSPDKHTPLSQFDFASFAQPSFSESWANGNRDPAFLDLDNPYFAPPFPSNEPLMDMTGFDWGGLESQLPLPTFEQNLQHAYLG